MAITSSKPNLPMPINIQYSKKRQTLCMRLKSGSLQVLAPAYCSEAHIQNFISKKTTWIMKQWHQHLKQQTLQPPAIPVSGAEYLVLGKPRTLILKEGKKSVSLRPNHLEIHVPKNTSNDQIKRIMRHWIRQCTHQYAEKRCKDFGQLMQLEARQIKVRAYRARWGCCRSNGVITFHDLLYMTPQYVFNSVIIHELAHLRHPNHSKQFWQLVKQFDPANCNSMAWLKANYSAIQI